MSACVPRAHVALAVAAGVAAALLYAGQFVISRWSFQRTLSPWDLAAIRFAVAGPLLLPIVLRHGSAHAAGIGWRRALVLATVAGAPYTLIMFAGLSLAPAAHGAVIITGGTPVVSMLLAWLWLGVRPTASQVGGVVLILIGLVLVTSASFAAGGDARVWLGDAILVIPTILWGSFAVLARRWEVDPARGTAIVWTLALAYVPAYLLVAGFRVLEAPGSELLLQAVYQGLGVAIAALALYSFAIRVLGASAASLFMPLVPVFGVLMAIPVLGEVPTAVQTIGMAGVCAGMVVASRARD